MIDKKRVIVSGGAGFIGSAMVRYLIKNTESTYFKNNNPFQGSFHATLYLAYLMGFSKVYLVGFDAWTRQPMLKLRWYEKGAFKYDPLKEYFDKQSINIGAAITLSFDEIETIIGDQLPKSASVHDQWWENSFNHYCFCINSFRLRKLGLEEIFLK